MESHSLFCHFISKKIKLSYKSGLTCQNNGFSFRREVEATKFIPWHCNFEDLQLEKLCKNLDLANQNSHFYEPYVQVNGKLEMMHESCHPVYGK